MFAMSVGAALGAGAMYLLDPEHGEGRRREAVTRAAERGRAELTDTTRELSRRAVSGARGLADQARTGFAAGAEIEVGARRAG